MPRVPRRRTGARRCSLSRPSMPMPPSRRPPPARGANRSRRRRTSTRTCSSRCTARGPSSRPRGIRSSRSPTSPSARPTRTRGRRTPWRKSGGRPGRQIQSHPIDSIEALEKAKHALRALKGRAAELGRHASRESRKILDEGTAAIDGFLRPLESAPRSAVHQRVDRSSDAACRTPSSPIQDTSRGEAADRTLRPEARKAQPASRGGRAALQQTLAVPFVAVIILVLVMLLRGCPGAGG